MLKCKYEEMIIVMLIMVTIMLKVCSLATFYSLNKCVEKSLYCIQ
jgi:hypothetical protein